MLTLKLIKKMRELLCSQQCPQFIDAFSILKEFEQQEKRAKNEEMSNLGLYLKLWFSKP
jgi:hypothetical protein